MVLVKFCDIDTQERAAELTNCDVWFPRSLTPDDEEQLSLASLVGFDIIEANTKKSAGRIADIDDSTANLLFELEDGTLIPASNDLIEDIDTDKRLIIMHLPEGILDI